VSKTIPVYFDGGVRKGSDVLKALALGADVVFLGRAALWGLSAHGQEGVEKVLEILNRELKEAMITTGCMNVA
jgi:(S)-2-hydroxy-acid oxidase